MKRQEALKLWRKPRRKKLQPEACLQYAVVEHLRLAATPGTWFLHPCNEGKRTPAEGAHLKRLGMMPGAADLMIVTRSSVCWLELKAKGEKPTPAQLDFGALAFTTGHHWNWADNIADALNYLRFVGALKPDVSLKRAA